MKKYKVIILCLVACVLLLFIYLTFQVSTLILWATSMLLNERDYIGNPFKVAHEAYRNLTLID